MTAREFIEKDDFLNEHFKGHYEIMLLIKESIIEFAESYAKSMCDKQKEICAKNAKIRTRKFSEDEGDDVSFWLDISEHYADYGDSVNVYDIEDQSILNAPYPKELI